MNCPSRTDNVDGREGWNQNPNLLEGTTREDFNGRTNARVLRRIDPDEPIDDVSALPEPEVDLPKEKAVVSVGVARASKDDRLQDTHVPSAAVNLPEPSFAPGGAGQPASFFQKARTVLRTFSRFIGPGFMISVAYIDPGNYSTGVSAGASYKFRLLFVILLANVVAIFLQSLCVKLGTVTGMDLAQMCRAHLPRWLNIFLYILAEGAIIATDIAEVIGTAIAINLLIPQIPLVAGCALSIIDVLLILLFYRPNGTMKGLRTFEFFVAALVLGVVICFCIQLSLIQDTSVGEVFRGYLPSSALVESKGLYQACGILGATVMPHSLYLGSGIVQPRLLEYDIKNGHATPPTSENSSVSANKPLYQPSLAAINFCMKYSITELAIALFTFALFVNSAILVVAGASLYGIDGVEDASLFDIHDLLSSSIAPVAGTIFALALLLSGISAGIVCTIAGQMVSEGALNWTLAPWLRRLITRSISITPSIIIAGAVGKEGLTNALNGSQVALSVALPFISAPIIYFTCRNKYMTVHSDRSRMTTNDYDDDDDGIDDSHTARPAEDAAGARLVDIGQLAVVNQGTKMRNNWLTTTIAVLIWLLVAIMNVANLVLLGLGNK